MTQNPEYRVWCRPSRNPEGPSTYETHPTRADADRAADWLRDQHNKDAWVQVVPAR